MGLFDSLFGSKKRTNIEVMPDLIWLTTDAKYAGLAKEVEERSKSETVLVVSNTHNRRSKAEHSVVPKPNPQRHGCRRIARNWRSSDTMNARCNEPSRRITIRISPETVRTYSASAECFARCVVALHCRTAQRDLRGDRRVRWLIGDRGIARGPVALGQWTMQKGQRMYWERAGGHP